MEDRASSHRHLAGDDRHPQSTAGQVVRPPLPFDEHPESIMKRIAVTAIALALAVWPTERRTAIGQAQRITLTATTSQDATTPAALIDRMVRSEELKVRRERQESLLPGRTFQQMDQY